MSKAHGSSGTQTPRRLVGPERASIRMLNGSSGQSDRLSGESACETGSTLCSGAAAGSQKFSLLASVSQRLNEMSPSRPRPPTPIGSNEEAGAVMAHLAPTRRSQSRFASPSKADSLAYRMTSKSSSFDFPSSTSQNHKAPSPHAIAPHDQPFSDGPEDVDAQGTSTAPMGSQRPGSGSQSPVRATHCVSFSEDPHTNAAPKQSSEKLTPSQLAPPSPNPSQQSAPLPTLPRLPPPDFSTGEAAALPLFLSGTYATVADSPRSRRRPSILGSVPMDSPSSQSQFGSLNLLQHSMPFTSTSHPQVAHAEHKFPSPFIRKSATYILDDLDSNVCGSPPIGRPFTSESRRNSTVGKQMPTVPDTTAALRNSQHGETVCPLTVDDRRPSFSALGLHDRGDSREGAVDALSSWMQNR